METGWLGRRSDHHRWQREPDHGRVGLDARIYVARFTEDHKTVLSYWSDVPLTGLEAAMGLSGPVGNAESRGHSAHRPR